MTWPAYTLCEPYAVLLAVLGLGSLAVAWPTAWEWGWSVYVSGMTVGAPLLAAARITRAVRSQAVEEEFARWFQPDPMSDGPRDASGGPHLTGAGRSARMDA